MSSEQCDSPQDQLEAVIARYLLAIEAGETVDRRELLSEHPGVAYELKQFFESHDRLRLAGTVTREEVTVSPEQATARQRIADTPTLAAGSQDSRGGENVEQHFGDYELIEEIARGGMGVVFRARQKSLNRIVALKMILAGQLAGPEDVKRFYVEAEAAANLDHPGIVPIYEVGECNGQHYFSMAYIKGKSLADVLQNGPLPCEAAAELTKRIAEAIAYAHGRGVIHRDLKPANILIEATGQPKITDFGVAKRMGGDSALTITGQILGTPSFMPPEQAAGRIRDVAEPADVYSIGAILYALLSGKPPFQAINPIDTLVQVLESEATLPTKLNRRVPRQLELICMRCLEKTPADRYPSAQALADDLERFTQGEPVEARALNAWHHLRRWARRQPALAAHLAGIVITMLAVQVTYLLVGTDLAYHLRFTGAFTLWGISVVLLQQFVDQPRWSSVAAALWAVVDAVLFTGILYLADSPLGPLLIGYPLLVACSGLFFRVRLVVITTIASAISYVTLMALRPAEIGPPQYLAFYLIGLVVLGCVVMSQVRRIRLLNRHFGSNS